jgi:hypothetical protein
MREPVHNRFLPAKAVMEFGEQAELQQAEKVRLYNY